MKSKVALKTFAIILIVTGCIYMFLNNLLHPLAIVLLVIIALPWLNSLYKDIVKIQLDNVRKLKKYLPKIGFKVESIEPQKDSNIIRFVGKFNEETIVMETSSDNAYVTIWDLAWLKVPNNDPNMPKFMEAINATNTQCGSTIVFSSPDDEGNRFIHTICSTVVPNIYISDFLNSTLIQMLNKKAALRENFKDYPWLNARKKNPIGFNVISERNNDEKTDDANNSQSENNYFTSK